MLIKLHAKLEFSLVFKHFYILLVLLHVVLANMAEAPSVEDQLALLQRDEDLQLILNKLEGAERNQVWEIIKSTMEPLSKKEVGKTEGDGNESNEVKVEPSGAMNIAQSNIPKLGTFSGD